METTKKDFVSFCDNLFFEDVESEHIVSSLIAKSGRKNKKIN
jgi:hypothetical protein